MPDAGGQPGSQQPYGKQSYGEQPYGEHQFGQPQYGQPQYGQPQYGQQTPGAAAPVGPDGQPPLWAPWYGISLPKAVGRFFRKYATFSGRASRSEFWWWTLVTAVVSTVLTGGGFLLAAALASTRTVQTDYGTYEVQNPAPPIAFVFLIAGLLWALATLVPSLALGWRRLHDANLSGALWIIALFVGIVGIVFGVLPSNPDGARFDRPGDR
ncbi:DUF805 domain-containing protein [Curtobacterium sp. MCPF17_046]|nr:DUF805 domain-containing protein [Curtobacterium sp. MCPF17_046]